MNRKISISLSANLFGQNGEIFARQKSEIRVAKLFWDEAKKGEMAGISQNECLKLKSPDTFIEYGSVNSYNPEKPRAEQGIFLLFFIHRRFQGGIVV